MPARRGCSATGLPQPGRRPGRVRLVDAPLDEVIARLVAEIQQFQPDIVIGHDALGQMTGHADHRRTHQATVLAVEAAALPGLHPEAGEPWSVGALYAATHPDSGVSDLAPLLAGVDKSLLTVPDAYVTATVDVTQYLNRKWAAICSHRSQLAGARALPALLSRLDRPVRARILGTEYFTPVGPVPFRDSAGGPALCPGAVREPGTYPGVRRGKWS
ncbi:PIG-L deacetylase family protein [Streptomyces clavuligerus]|nr:PIG-L family deacetylase [Streptomyces clavuligerus]